MLVSLKSYSSLIGRRFKALRDTKTKKAAGPDGIPSVVPKLFAFELAPIVPIFTTQRFVTASFLLSSRVR